MNNFREKVSFIWSIAELLRGPYKPAQYGRVILPMTVLRRLDCVLEPTKDKVLDKYKDLKRGSLKNVEPILNRTAKQKFHNVSRFNFERLKGDPDKVAENLTHYIKSFSSKAREIIEYFGFEAEIEKMDKHNRLFLVVSRFCDIDLHPKTVSNLEMGYVFEELIRRFNEASNETAGDHFTPREVIRLMVNVLFNPDSDVLTRKGIVKTVFDPACGTGGMLSVAEDYVHELNPHAKLEVFGQDYNEEAYAICGSDMLIKGQNPDNIRFGDSFTHDGFPREHYDYMLANPPFGVEWKPQEDLVKKEHETKGFAGRFGPGLPRISDGSLLFLMHMISKFKQEGSRLAIVFNGSPLFTGSAGSGESNIRRWIIENDWLEAIIAMPDQLFYNTGISTYVWIVTNRKEKHRRGKVQLINAVSFFQKMRKSLGNKRNEIGDGQEGRPDHIGEITRVYGAFKEGEFSKIFDGADFGYRRITVERPLRLNFQVTQDRIDQVAETKAFQNLATSKKKDKKAAAAEIAAGEKEQGDILSVLSDMIDGRVYKNREDFEEVFKKAFKKAGVALPAPLKKAILGVLSERDEEAEICMTAKGELEADSDLRDYENVPLKEDIQTYFKREVLPHVPDAWINESVVDDKDGEIGKVGYEINFNRYFYKYEPPRPLEEIDADIKALEMEIVEMLREVTA